MRSGFRSIIYGIVAIGRAVPLPAWSDDPMPAVEATPAKSYLSLSAEVVIEIQNDRI